MSVIITKVLGGIIFGYSLSFFAPEEWGFAKRNLLIGCVTVGVVLLGI